MIESLAKIISHFPGAANRARCTGHIVNLAWVSKIILRQFNARKKTIGAKKTLENANDKAEPDDKDDFTSLAEDLDREEQEAANDKDEDISENLAADLENIEEAMKEEIVEVAKKVKPIQCVLFKVRFNYSY